MEPKYVIVQAGGKGTRMEQLTKNKPKALVPVDNLPILFHLFRKFPDKHFIVVGDYKFDVLKRYLEAFAAVDYTLVSGAGFSGTCAGLRDAAAQVPSNEPVMLIWSDLVLSKEFSCPGRTGNFIGIAKDFPCRWKFENGRLCEEPSNHFGVAGLFIFENKQILDNVPESGEFVRWLQTSQVALEPLDIYKTKEYGLISEYRMHVEEPRCRPFNRIRTEGSAIIKEGIDQQGLELAKRECDWYQRVMDQQFEQIPRIYSLKPLKMERIDGNNIYAYSDLSYEQKSNILTQIVDCLNHLHELGEVPSDRDSYEQAYIGKTFERLEKIRNLVPFSSENAVVINGKRCRNVFFHRDVLTQKVMQYIPKSFKFIHGDCTFSNILLKQSKTPVLIDPRGYFGTTKLYGDPAYDWVKLYYSVVGNYDQFNRKHFTLTIGESDVELQIDSNQWEDMEPLFFELLEGQVTPEQIKLFHAIIWLSLTTYAWEDYDSICGAFYNGLLYLEDLL